MTPPSSEYRNGDGAQGKSSGRDQPRFDLEAQVAEHGLRQRRHREPSLELGSRLETFRCVQAHNHVAQESLRALKEDALPDLVYRNMQARFSKENYGQSATRSGSGAAVALASATGGYMIASAASQASFAAHLGNALSVTLVGGGVVATSLAAIHGAIAYQSAAVERSTQEAIERHTNREFAEKIKNLSYSDAGLEQAAEFLRCRRTSYENSVFNRLGIDLNKKQAALPEAVTAAVPFAATAYPVAAASSGHWADTTIQNSIGAGTGAVRSAAAAERNRQYDLRDRERDRNLVR
jgi:hypothetical protein